MFIDTSVTLGGQFRSLETPISLTGCVDFASDGPPSPGEHNQEVLGASAA
jgi:hypothetical protein